MENTQVLISRRCLCQLIWGLSCRDLGQRNVFENHETGRSCNGSRTMKLVRSTQREILELRDPLSRLNAVISLTDTTLTPFLDCTTTNRPSTSISITVEFNTSASLIPSVIENFCINIIAPKPSRKRKHKSESVPLETSSESRTALDTSTTNSCLYADGARFIVVVTNRKFAIT